MTEQNESLILELLRAMRTDIRQARDDLSDIKLRTTSIEHSLSHLLANDAGQSGRIDRLEQRIEHIEHRLELRDAT